MTFFARQRRFVAVLVVFAMTIAVSVVTPTTSATAVAEAPDADGVIVKWEEGRVESGLRALERRGLNTRRSMLGGRVVSVDADPEDIQALVYELSAIPGVEFVEPDYRVHVTWQPDDPGYADQWAYSRIQAESIWDVEQGDAEVLVAVIDTGVDLDHVDLAENLDVTNDRNFTVGPSDPAYYVADDDHGHGTHVAGIIAAETDNDAGVAGTAPGVTILPIKAISASGSGSAMTLAAAIDYATSVGADVINLSLAFDYGESSELVNEVIHDATVAGVVVVAASGNSGDYGVRYPAAYPDCIAVGASTIDDERTYFSTYGPELDVVAPGGRATVADASGLMVLSTYTENRYAYMEGTSMATPFVAAAAAILRSYGPGATPASIREALESSAKDIDPAGFDNYTGYGLVQLRDALDYLIGTDATPPVTTSDIVATYDDAATITLVADDGDGLGVAATYASVDEEAWQQTNTLWVTGYGAHAVSYWSDDVAGNRETTNTEMFFIDDSLPPVTSSDTQDSYESTASITLTAEDGDGSGVADTYFSLDGGDRVYATALTTSDIGEHTLIFGSVDVAGNTETSKTVDFTILGVPDVSRVYGPTRYETAVAMSQAAFGTGSVSTVVLASGENFPDALSASGLAGVIGSPVLLTPRAYLSTAAKTEIARLGATKVLVIGGAAAVSDAVADALRDEGLSVERLAGADRYATAEKVARRVAEESGVTVIPVAFVVRGDQFPDALAVSSLAASQGYPVLLTRSDRLVAPASSAIEDLGVSEVIIAGGIPAVSDAVAESLSDLDGVSVVNRWSGTDRYATAAAVVRNGVARGWTGDMFFGVATGVNFPDALGGGVVSAKQGGALLLTAPDALTAVTRAVIVDHGSGHLPIWLYGGPSAVSTSVSNSLSELRF